MIWRLEDIVHVILYINDRIRVSRRIEIDICIYIYIHRERERERARESIEFPIGQAHSAVCRSWWRRAYATRADLGDPLMKTFKPMICSLETPRFVFFDSHDSRCNLPIGSLSRNIRTVSDN